MILLAAWGDLWFDEIWSLSKASAASTPWELFTHFRHDNNHLLNTLFFYLIGPQTHLIFYRLLAIISGIGSLFLIGHLARRHGMLESLFALILSGLSFPLILYFSEARGYAPALFFALSAYTILTGNWNGAPWSKVLTFWICLILGFLSHATFILVLTALMTYSFFHEIRRSSTIYQKALHLFTYYALPLLLFFLFYLFYLSDIQVGGGPIHTTWDVLCQTTLVVLGFPDTPLLRILSIISAASIISGGIYILFKEGDDRWVFFAVILFVAPLLLISITQPEFLYFRYFILCFPFFYILLSYLLGKLYRASFKGAKIVFILLILLYLAGQSQRIIPLLHLRRGNYNALLQDIATHSENKLIRVGSDNDHRNLMLVVFYAQCLPEGTQIQYVERSNWQQERPDWMIAHSQKQDIQPLQHLNLPEIGPYEFVKTYGYSGFSGWSWFLYRAKQTVQ